MDNFTSNASEVDHLSLVRSVLTGIFLTQVIIVAAVDILVIGALFANAQLNRTVRFLLVNLLLAGLAVAAASIIFHSYYGASLAWGSLGNRQIFIGVCQSAAFLFLFGGAGRFLFTTLYATTVFVLVRFWNKPTIDPRNTKYFVVTAVVIWIVAALAATPVISRELMTSLCVRRIQRLDIGFYAYLSSHIVVFSLLPAVLSLILLIVSACYLRRAVANSPGAKKMSKSMLKFGFFLLLGQGFNIAGQILTPILGIIISILTEEFPAVLLNACIFDLSLIPTPILVTLFFTSLWEKMKTRIFNNNCCCPHKPVPSKAEP